MAKTKMKILWCVTGAGEFLKESLEILSKLGHADITIFVSRAGEEVLRSYKLFRHIKKTWKLFVEDDFASMPAGKVTLGIYDVVIVSPATANTVAKVANGIADNLVTTAASLAIKSGTKLYMVPTDWVPKKVDIPDALTPGGRIVHMNPRKADLRNLKFLEDEGVILLKEPNALLKELAHPK